MSTASALSGPAPAKPSEPGSKRRLYPGWVVRGFLVLNLALVLFARVFLVEADIALANLLTAAGLLGSAICLWLWFVIFSEHSLLVRMLTVVASGAMLVGAFRVVREVRFAGNMQPRIYWMWEPIADRTLTTPIAETSEPDSIALQDEVGFPQFLGPDRTGYLPGPKLARDWNARPPKELWRQKIGAGWSGFVAHSGLAVTMEQRGDDELVTCYQTATGKVVWSHAVKTRHDEVMGGVGPRSTPAIAGGKVYALGATGVLRCLDLRTGDLVWHDDLLERGGTVREKDSYLIQWGRANSPLVVGQRLIVPLGGRTEKPTSLIAYDKDSGEVLWTGGEQQISYASAGFGALAGREQVVIVNESSVSGHDPESGVELWRYSWFGRSNADASASQAHILPEGQVFISKGYQGGAKLLQITEEQGKFSAEAAWENPKALKTKFTNVVLIGDFAYGLSDGILECIDWHTGKSKWRKGRYGQGQVLGVGDCLLVQAEEGHVVQVDASPDKFTELGRLNALSDKTWNNLCLYGQVLIVRNSVEAVAYELNIADE